MTPTSGLKKYPLVTLRPCESEVCSLGFTAEKSHKAKLKVSAKLCSFLEALEMIPLLSLFNL